MRTRADNASAARKKTAPLLPEMKKEGKATASPYSDNRPENAAQQQLQQSVSDSPQVRQMKAMQQMADNSPRINAGMGGEGIVQRTVYKIASEGPEFHESDPERYANRIGDEHVHKSLHKYKPGEIDMRVATSPITIFIHGKTLEKFTAKQFFDFLDARGYTPKPDTEIVFITCGGANLMDEFLVSKGQALADKLGATVHLAKGVVKINADGVPVVDKPDGSGKFPFITSQEELKRIIPKGAEGWKVYRPQGVTYDMVKSEILIARSELRALFEEQMFLSQVDWYRDTFEGILEELKTDRSDIVNQYKEVKDVRRTVQEKYLPSLVFYKELKRTIALLRGMLEETTRYKDRVRGLLTEYEGWARSVASGKGDLQGFKLLYEDKQREWIAPLQEQMAQEKSEKEIANAPDDPWGLNEDIFAGMDDAEATPKAPTPSAKVTSLRAKGEKNGVVQRQVIDPAPATVNGKTLSQILNALPDMDLVTNGRNLDLSLAYTSMKPYGRTMLKANGTLVPPSFVTRATANQHYEIVIELNKEVYHSGQNAPAMGSLIETLTHEWSLHGAEYAVNINSARHDLDPDVSIGHDRLFSEEMTHMDMGIALQIIRKENAAFVPGIYEAYMNDVRNHVGIMQQGWDEENPIKGKKLYGELDYVVLINKLIQPVKEIPVALKKEILELTDSLSFRQKDYTGVASADDMNIPETLGLMQKILGMDMRGLTGPIEMLPDKIRETIPLLKELETVKHASAQRDPTAARKKALETFGINTAQLDKLMGSSGTDRGADFKRAEKKGE